MSQDEALHALESKMDELEKRLDKLEGEISAGHQEVVDRLTAVFQEKDMAFTLKATPQDYYEWTLDQRREYLQADSVEHLCKSLIVENTRHPGGMDDPDYCQFYLLIIQYTESYKPNKLFTFLRSLKQNSIGRKNYKLHFAKPHISQELSGYRHNAVTPFGMATNIPVVLSDKAAALENIWLGGGAEDLKLNINIKEYITKFNPHVTDITVDPEA